MSNTGFKSIKNRAPAIYFALVSLLVGMVPALAKAQDYVTAGTAYSLNSNQVLYRELYTGIDENKSVRVDYVSPEGKTFATKTLVYSGELFQPMFNFEDTRDNEFASARFAGARWMLTKGARGHQGQNAGLGSAQMARETVLGA